MRVAVALALLLAAGACVEAFKHADQSGLPRALLKKEEDDKSTGSAKLTQAEEVKVPKQEIKVDVPKAIEKPVVSEQPVVSEKPVIQKPVVEDKPVVIKQKNEDTVEQPKPKPVEEKPKTETPPIDSITCKAPKVPTADKKDCECPASKPVPVGEDGCKEKETPIDHITCQPPKVPTKDKKDCECPPNTTPKGDKCLPTRDEPVVCKSPKVPSSDKKTCVCPPGKIPDGEDGCKDGGIVPPVVCKSPKVPSSDKKTCVCPPGQIPDGEDKCKPGGIVPPVECPKDHVKVHGKCYKPPKPYPSCDKDEHNHCKPRYWYCQDECHPKVVKCKRPGKVVVEFITIEVYTCKDLLDDWYEWVDDEGYCVLTIIDEATCPCSDCWKPEHGIERCPCHIEDCPKGAEDYCDAQHSLVDKILGYSS